MRKLFIETMEFSAWASAFLSDDSTELRRMRCPSRPVHGPFREAVLGPAFRPGSTDPEDESLEPILPQ